MSEVMEVPVNSVSVEKKPRKTPVRRTVEERQAELVKARETHVGHIKSIDEKLAALNGAVSVNKVYETTKKWLEALPTVKLRAQASVVGIETPEEYEDLDVLVGDILTKMGIAQEVEG